eukprot:snap_masked-scaffold_4-processed-gene-20.24-mRNA-1 protein AED:1.00 eAED:1.00 QI:0/0/0/0/1/1/2/0/103
MKSYSECLLHDNQVAFELYIHVSFPRRTMCIVIAQISSLGYRYGKVLDMYTWCSAPEKITIMLLVPAISKKVSTFYYPKDAFSSNSRARILPRILSPQSSNTG